MGSFEKKGASYHYQFYHDNQKFRKSMKTGDLREAKVKAKAFEQSVRKAKSIMELELLKNKCRFAKLSTVVELYMKACANREITGRSMGTQTAGRNVSSLVQIVGNLDQSSRCLTTRNLDLFAENRLVGLKGVELTKGRNTIESIHRKARSIFSEWALKIYRDNNLLLPDVVEWKKYRAVKEDHGSYRLPIEDPELCAHIRKKGAELLDQKSHLAVGWLLSYELALRAKEIAHLRFNWFVKRGDHYALAIINRPEQDFKPKGTNREIQVHEKLYFEIARQARGCTDLWVAPGRTFTDRYNYIVRDLAKWMRSEGFTADRFDKASYELRKLKGSEWYSSEHLGPQVAQEWLGHKDISTTCKYYAALDRKITPLAPNFKTGLT